jgi:hypothetical protein
MSLVRAESLIINISTGSITSVGQRPMKRDARNDKAPQGRNHITNDICRNKISPRWGFGFSVNIHSIGRCPTLLIIRLSARTNDLDSFIITFN